MPLYEYECESCGKRFERIQKFSDPPPESCPTCGQPVKRLVSSPAVHFKGSGWYVTDYGKGSSEKGGDKGSDKGGDKGSDKSSPSADSSSKSGDSAAKGTDSKSGDSAKPSGPAPSSTDKKAAS